MRRLKLIILGSCGLAGVLGLTGFLFAAGAGSVELRGPPPTARHRVAAPRAKRPLVHRYRIQASGNPVLITASAPALAVDGTYLSAPPPGVTPHVSASRAARIVAGSSASGSIREEVLARVEEPHNSTWVQDSLFWIVSTGTPTEIGQFFGTPRGHAGAPTQMNGFVLGFVNANTGQFMGTIADGTPVGVSSGGTRRGGRSRHQ